MKFLLVIAALVVVAIAGPTNRLVDVGAAGPADVIDDYQPIVIDRPALVEEEKFQEIEVGPALVDQPVYVGPAIIDEFHPIQVDHPIIDDAAPIIVGDAGSSIVKIVINVINGGQSNSPVDAETGEIATPVEILEDAEESEGVIEVADLPTPVEDVEEVLELPPPGSIGTPVLPGLPVISQPEALN